MTKKHWRNPFKNDCSLKIKNGAQPYLRSNMMEFLNKKATEVFGRLKDSLKDGQYRRIENEPYMPLTMEKIAERIQTPWGTAAVYSLCHYYEQNGDLMQDPEMCFLVIDEDGEATTAGRLKIAPFIFQQANLGIYQQSILMADDKVTQFKAKMQQEHTEFANQWLSNIEEQGFLK